MLGPVLYLLYTCDIPTIEMGTIVTFADDTAILAVGETIEDAIEKLQTSVNKIHEWTRKWRIKLNEIKSAHVDFTHKNVQHLPDFLNNKKITYSNSAKYLGITLDAELRWRAHVKKKREELEIKYKTMYWLIGRNANIQLHNKLLIYKQVLKPV